MSTYTLTALPPISKGLVGGAAIGGVVLVGAMTGLILSGKLPSKTVDNSPNSSCSSQNGKCCAACRPNMSAIGGVSIGLAVLAFVLVYAVAQRQRIETEFRRRAATVAATAE